MNKRLTTIGLLVGLPVVFLTACSTRQADPASETRLRSDVGAVDTQPKETSLRGFQLGLITGAPTSFEGAEFNESSLGTQGAGARLDKSGPLAKLNRSLSEVFRASSAAQVSGDLSAQEAVRKTVVVDAVATGSAEALLRDLRALGLANGAAVGGLVSGRLEVAALGQAAELPSLRTMRPSVAVLNVGKVTGEASRALAADKARLEQGVEGEGQTVGILSDSFDRIKVPECGPGGDVIDYAADVASGDLPEGVAILEDGLTEVCDPDPEVLEEFTDEGRGMAQLVYDVAPGVNLAFHTGFAGQANFAQGVLDLAEAGSTVIVDDVVYFAEPMFQDGIIAQAADTVAKGGVPYFSSAGNEANASYESPFRSSGQELIVDTDGDGKAERLGTLHDFSGSGQTLQTVVLQPGETVAPALQWDHPFASTSETSLGSSSDLDLYLFVKQPNDTAFTFADSFSADPNIGADPFEIAGVINPLDTPIIVGIAITLFEGEAPGLIKYVNVGFSEAPLDPPLDAPTSYGHNNAANVRGVGAAFWQDTPAFGTAPPLPEPFTSLGGVPILFDVEGRRLARPELRPQPDFTASDGDNTTFFFSDIPEDDDAFPNFFGTSAAAPNAAAIAALQFSKNPDLGVEQVYRGLEESAVDMLSPGFDTLTGTGLVQADRALDRYFTIKNATELLLKRRGNRTVHLRLETDRKGGNKGIVWRFKKAERIPGVFLKRDGRLVGVGSKLVAGSYAFTAEARDRRCKVGDDVACIVRKTFNLKVK